LIDDIDLIVFFFVSFNPLGRIDYCFCPNDICVSNAFNSYCYIYYFDGKLFFVSYIFYFIASLLLLFINSLLLYLINSLLLLLIISLLL